MPTGLVLRDVHRPSSPSWWPPAPGWWWLALGFAVVAIALWWWRRRRAERRALAFALFDAETAGTHDAATRLAKASELLRRAARRVRADADRLDGEAWLQWLDTPQTRFVDGPGRLLLDGPFRRDLADADLDAAVAVARTRFAMLMARGR